jgi:hypothetical protein
MPVQIADELLVQLRKIGVDDETKWRTAPKTFGRTPGPADLESARPVVQVHIGRKSSEPWTNDLHEDALELQVYCISESAQDPEGALWDLISDVERSIRENMKLGTVLASGMLHHSGSEPFPEMVKGKAGLGFGIVTALATYKTTDADP